MITVINRLSSDLKLRINQLITEAATADLTNDMNTYLREKLMMGVTANMLSTNKTPELANEAIAAPVERYFGIRIKFRATLTTKETPMKVVYLSCFPAAFRSEPTGYVRKRKNKEMTNI